MLIKKFLQWYKYKGNMTLTLKTFLHVDLCLQFKTGLWYSANWNKSGIKIVRWFPIPISPRSYKNRANVAIKWKKNKVINGIMDEINISVIRTWDDIKPGLEWWALGLHTVTSCSSGDGTGKKVARWTRPPSLKPMPGGGLVLLKKEAKKISTNAEKC